MVKKSKTKQAYRHTPAFILLFLAQGDLYGAAILTTLQKELPCYHTDSAVIYRSLKDLEEEEAVSSYWETDTSGPAKKWYKITQKGKDLLIDFKEDIEMRKKNLDYFIESFNSIK
ncbi:MAG TPA: PadR family transcriptional regulator [Fibrobacteres bacterium]|jgi:PadR family transcriptional regulator, regulatory protein PadR|nr:PadR family transcriptional regulator [Fibrobacterota bacterium]